MRTGPISFESGDIYIPPQTYATIDAIELDFPEDRALVRSLLPPGLHVAEFPNEAFSEDGSKLLCLAESSWTANEKTDFFEGRRLPAFTYETWAGDSEIFQNIEKLDTSSAGDVAQFAQSYGLPFAPMHQSQKRFIDSRFHSDDLDEDSPLSYLTLYDRRIPSYILEILESTADEDQSDEIFDLTVAAWSIYAEEVARLGHVFLEDDPYQDLTASFSGSFTEAVILSEYARRRWCDIKAPEDGGITSLYEVSLTFGALQKAFRIIASLDVAPTPDKLEESLSSRLAEDDREMRRLSALELNSAEDLHASGISDPIANLYERPARQALDFISRCVTETRGASTITIQRKTAEANDGQANTPAEMYDLTTRARFYRNKEPRYLHDRYVEGSFSALMCAHFLNAMQNPHPWCQCQNESCGRYFKHKRTTTGKGIRNRKGSKYCSEHCARTAGNSFYNKENSIVKLVAKRHPNLHDARQEAEKLLKAQFPDREITGKDRERWRKKLMKAYEEAATSK